MQPISKTLASIKTLSLILLLLHFHNTLGDYKISIMRDGIKIVNPCSNDLLSNFFSDVDPTSLDTAVKSSKEIVNACPTLRYSCCDISKIKKLKSQANDALNFKDFQLEYMKKMFNLAKQIPMETFEVFLSEMTNEDIKCYNQMKANEGSKLISVFAGAKISLLEDNEPANVFDIEKLKNTFQELQERITPYLKQINSVFSSYRKYYSGLICSVCSPNMVKNFKKNEEGQFELNVNQFMCQSVGKTQLKALAMNYIYGYIQELINVTYCVRNNSKKDVYKYDEDKWEDNVITSFDPYKIPNYMENREFCVNTDNAFTLPEMSKFDCKEFCQNSLNLFDLTVFNLTSVIRIENNLRQMFYGESSPEDAKKRLDRNMDTYLARRQQEVDKGILTMKEKSHTGKISVFKLVDNHVVDFSKLNLSVDMHLGANFRSTPMDEMFFNFLKIISMFAIINFMILFA